MNQLNLKNLKLRNGKNKEELIYTQEHLFGMINVQFQVLQKLKKMISINLIEKFDSLI